MRSPLVPLAALLALVTLVVVTPACKGKSKVSFDVDVPGDVLGDTVWLEIGAYRDSSCNAVGPMLANGVPDSATARVAFRRDAAEPPSLGDLDRGSYAFAAVAKGEDCRVLASGCVEVNLAKADSVAISMAKTEPPSGACGAGAVCAAARCVPANDNKDPSVGAECSLELLGAGPLASPVTGEGTSVSAPAIAATSSGFVIVYREIDADGANARVTVLPIDAAGGALAPARPLLSGRCANSDETDGVGLVMDGDTGHIVLARSACGAKPGLELLDFTSNPTITIDPDFRSSDSPTARRLVLSAGHVAARGSGASVVVFNQDGASHIATIVPGKGVVAPSGTFGGSTGMTGAWVASNDTVLAVLSAGPPAGAPVVDAGADGGGDAGEAPPGSDSELGLIMVPSTTPADQFSLLANKPRVPLTFPGVWGAVAALGSRVLVVSDGSGPGVSVAYRTFDLDRPATAEPNGFSVGGAGEVTTADVTMLNDKAYIAVLKPGGVSLHVFANASTTPRPLREIIFGAEPRIPSVYGVRDTGRVAVAATDSRVAVAWTTAKSLTNNDASGGYAVFACTP